MKNNNIIVRVTEELKKKAAAKAKADKTTLTAIIIKSLKKYINEN